MKSLVKIAKDGFLLLIILLLAWNVCILGVRAEGNYTVSEIDGSRKGTIRIVKNVTDLKDGSVQPAEGVSYQITYQVRLDSTEVGVGDKDYFREIRITDAAGAAEFTNLALGTYLVEEVAGTPAGMEKSESFLVSVPCLNVAEVTYDGVVYEPGSIYEYDITATPKCQPILGAVRLIKMDSQTGARLQGAVFQLYQESGEACLTESGQEVKLTTDANGMIEIKNLPYGSYYFLEKSAPDGYEISNEKHSFLIAQSYQEGKEDTMVIVWVENTPQTEPETPTETEPETPTESEVPTEPNGPEILLPPNGPKNPNKPTTTNSPKTGDENSVIVWMGLLCISMAVLGSLFMRKRRTSS